MPWDWDPDQDPADCPGKMTDGICIYQGSSSSPPEGHIIDRNAGAPGYEGNQLWQDLNAQYPDNVGGAWFNDPVDGWRPFNSAGVSDACPGPFCGDQYNYQPENYLYTPQKRYHAFAQGGYEINDYLRSFFEASFTNRYSAQKLPAEPLFTIVERITVSADNAYNPFGRDFIDIRRRLNEFGNRTHTQDSDTFRATLGLEGDFPGGWGPFSSWHWEASYLWGRSTTTEMQAGNLHLTRLANTLGPSYLDGGVAYCGGEGVRD